MHGLPRLLVLNFRLCVMANSVLLYLLIMISNIMWCQRGIEPTELWLSNFYTLNSAVIQSTADTSAAERAIQNDGCTSCATWSLEISDAQRSGWDGNAALTAAVLHKGSTLMWSSPNLLSTVLKTMRRTSSFNLSAEEAKKYTIVESKIQLALQSKKERKQEEGEPVLTALYKLSEHCNSVTNNVWLWQRWFQKTTRWRTRRQN